MQHTIEHPINSGIDYRKKELASHGESYFLKHDEQKFNQMIVEMTGVDLDDLDTKVLTVFGRKLFIRKCYENIAVFTMKELCEEPLAAQDYLEICENFKIVFLRDIRKIDLQTERSTARRFISLIDQLYDNRIGVVCLADEMPQNIFKVESVEGREWSWEEREFMDDLKVQGTEQAEALSILTGQEEAFSLKRLISRLYEMKTQDYWNDVLRRMKE